MIDKKSVLYLTYDGMSDILGQSQILPYLERLAESGYGITVVSFEKAQIYPLSPGLPIGRAGLRRIKWLKAQSIFEKLNIRHIPLGYHKSPPVLSTIYDIWILRKTCRILIKDRDLKIVHCRSYITALVGLWLRRKFGLKLIFDMRGFWADERVDGGLWDLRNPIYRLVYRYFKKMEAEFLREADWVVSLTESGVEVMVNGELEAGSWKLEAQSSKLKELKPEKKEWLREKVSVIPTCVDLGHFDPGKVPVEETRQIRQQLGLEDGDFLLLYLGSLGTWYMLEEMLDFFEVLRGQYPSAKFLLLTKDTDALRAHLARWPKLAGNQCDESLTITVNNQVHEVLSLAGGAILSTSACRDQVPLFLSICQASVFFIQPSFSKKASAATKMAEVLAMGKPIITNAGWGDAEAFCRHHRAGLVVEDFKKDHYREIIDQLKSLKEIKPEYYRKLAMTHFSLDRGVQSYHQIYETLAGNHVIH